MIICFLADGDSVNTRSWVEHFSTQLGHEIHIITLHECGYSLNNCLLHIIYNKFIPKKVHYFFGLPKIRQIIRSIKPDILIGYRLTGYGFMAACAGFRPMVLAATGGDVHVEAKNSLLKRFFVKFALRRASLVHAWSKNIADALLDLGVAENKIFLLPRGIEMEMFQPFSECVSNRNRIITTRSLVKNCRVEIILKAIAQVRKDIPEIEYFIVGDGPRRAFLEDHANKLGISENVHFVGRIRRELIPKFLRDSDVYCSMNETEGLSASLVESMAVGCFPIVADIGANQIWVNDEINGFLVRVNAVDELARLIIRALRNDDLRNKAKQLNRNIVESKLDIEKNLKIFEMKYNKLLEQRQVYPEG
jgi:glycosyltransferase involved in cell wall biosynthesis